MPVSFSNPIIMWMVPTAVWSVSYWVSQRKKISPNNNTIQYLQISPSTQQPNTGIVLTLEKYMVPVRIDGLSLFNSGPDNVIDPVAGGHGEHSKGEVGDDTDDGEQCKR